MKRILHTALIIIYILAGCIRNHFLTPGSLIKGFKEGLWNKGGKKYHKKADKTFFEKIEHEICDTQRKEIRH